MSVEKCINNISTYLALLVAGSSAFSVTMGAHRLYTHRTFKCNDWVKALLVFGQTVAGQVSLYIIGCLHIYYYSSIILSLFLRKTVGLIVFVIIFLNVSCRCPSELLVRLDQRPSAASQIQRHGGRPAQRVTGVLLLAHRVVDGSQASWSHWKRQKDWYDRHRNGSLRHVSKKVSCISLIKILPFCMGVVRLKRHQ